jgi:hypothetical protein
MIGMRFVLFCFDAGAATCFPKQKIFAMGLPRRIETRVMDILAKLQQLFFRPTEGQSQTSFNPALKISQVQLYHPTSRKTSAPTLSHLKWTKKLFS